MKMFKLFFVLTALNFAVIAQDSICTINTSALLNPESLVPRPSMQFTIVNEYFIVHYDISGNHGTTHSYANNVSSYAQTFFEYCISEIGFTLPPPDEGRGGDDRYDIYIQNLSTNVYGEAIADGEATANNEGVPSFVKIDNNITDELLLKITVAHECFHGVEYGYTAYEFLSGNPPALWFFEMSAVYIADLTFQEKFYLNYLIPNVNYPSLYSDYNPLITPEVAITGKGAPKLYEYSGVLFIHFLTQKLNDVLIIKNFWERFASNPGRQPFDDINYILSEFYDISLEESLYDYAVWRYFTGTRAVPGEFFEDAAIYPTSSVYSTIDSYPLSNHIVANLISPGGVKYIKLTNGDVFNFSFNGYENSILYGYSIWDYSPNSAQFIPLNFINANDIPNTQIVRNESDGIALAFINTSNQIYGGGLLSASKESKSQVYFKNYVNGAFSTEGQFLLNGTTNLNSGSSVLLDFNTNHSVKTLTERFDIPLENMEPNKHLDWNGKSSSYLFNNSFDVISGFDNSQIARFIPLKQTLIRNSFDGHTFTDGAAIKFNDPWYLNSDGSQSGMNNFLTATSPYLPTGAYNKSTGGVFLDISGGQQNWSIPYYSVQKGGFSSLNLTQTGKSHNAYFLGWLANPSSGAEFQYPYANTSGVVIKTEGTQIQANYKLTELTNNSSAYANSGQRHLGRRAYNGDTYNVYESMGYIWLEKSTDNGSTWTLANDAAPVSAGIAKSPSLDFCTDHLLIVYQEKTSSGYLRIKLKLYDVSEDEVIDSAVVMENNNVDFSFDTQPVIADYYSTGRFMVIYRNNMDHDPFYDTGLHYDYGVVAYDYQTYSYHLTDLNAGNDLYISGTNSKSVNPSVSTTPSGLQDNIHLLWQQGNLSDQYCHIMYQKIVWNGSTFSFPAQENISYGKGYTWNYKPSITSITSDDIPRVTWIGYIDDSEQEFEKQGNTNGTTGVQSFRETVFRALDNPSAWSFGSNVVHANINRLESTPGYAIAWSQQNGSSFLNKCMKNTNFYTEYTLSTSGSAVELNNGGLFTTMFGYALHTGTTPYYFNKSQYLSAVQKEQLNSMSASRAGVLFADNAQFIFSFGDITADNNPVLFPVIPDTLNIQNFEHLKQFMVSDPFMLQNQSEFGYSVQYRVLDTAGCSAVLGETGIVNFRLVLEDYVTGEILGEYDNVNFTRNALTKYDNISYQVNTSGIGTRQVRLRLIPSSSVPMNSSLLTRVRSANEVSKGNVKQVYFNGSSIVTDYSLSQNYPNPFNPVTQIEYALPVKSEISVKVYDILGNELAVLASGLYEPGRYSVPFDGGSYASGVYIYKLSYGRGQNITKKMTLLK